MEMSSSLNLPFPLELVTIILRYALIDDPALYSTYLGNGEPERTPLTSARERLKQLRLEGHAFCDAVTPAVFASIHLHASSLSMKRAESIANSRLATHVKEIVHHQGTFAGWNEDRQRFLNALASYQRRQDYPAELRTADREAFYENFLEERKAAKDFAKGGGFRTYPFQVLGEKLPKCKTFVSLPYNDEWHDPETSAYTLRRTGFSYLPMPGVADLVESHWFTSAITTIRPLCLNLSIFPCDAAYALLRQVTERHHDSTHDNTNSLTYAKDRFSRLEDLKLGPAYGAKYGYGGGGQWSSVTTLLLRACENLVSLELTNDYPLDRKFVVLPQDGLPKLTKLTISKGSTLGYWPATGMLQCIKNVGKTLQHLHFDGVVLKDWAHGSHDAGRISHDLAEAPNCSFIGLLFEVSAHTNLKSCTGLETVDDVKSGVGSKATNIRPGMEVLLKKLEEAVCHRRQWPSNFPLLLTLHRTSYTSVTKNNPEVDVVLAFIHGCWDDTFDES